MKSSQTVVGCEGTERVSERICAWYYKHFRWCVWDNTSCVVNIDRFIAPKSYQGAHVFHRVWPVDREKHHDCHLLDTVHYRFKPLAPCLRATKPEPQIQQHYTDDNNGNANGDAGGKPYVFRYVVSAMHTHRTATIPPILADSTEHSGVAFPAVP